MKEHEARLMNYAAPIRRLRKATGFLVFVKEVATQFRVPHRVALRSARDFWTSGAGSFKPPYRLTEMIGVKMELKRKLTECNFLIDELEDEINREIVLRARHEN